MDKTVQMEIVGFVGIGFLLAMYLGQTVIAGTAVGILGGVLVGKSVLTDDTTPAETDSEGP
jgi:hypothetical protein